MNLSQFHHDLTSGLSYILVYQIPVLFLMKKVHVETFVNLNPALFLTIAYCLPGPSAVNFPGLHGHAFSVTCTQTT